MQRRDFLKKASIGAAAGAATTLAAPAIAAEARRLEDDILAGRVAPSVAAEELLARFQP